MSSKLEKRLLALPVEKRVALIYQHGAKKRRRGKRKAQTA